MWQWSLIARRCAVLAQALGLAAVSWSKPGVGDRARGLRSSWTTEPPWGGPLGQFTRATQWPTRNLKADLWNPD